MALINVKDVQIENSFGKFSDPIAMNITFESLQPLKTEIEWEVTYIGAPSNPSCDQQLDSFSIGPIPQGTMVFQILANPPDIGKIPRENIFDTTALLVSVTFKKQEFFRIGYFVSCCYQDPLLVEQQLDEVLVDKLFRSILTSKPIITSFSIN